MKRTFRQRKRLAVEGLRSRFGTNPYTVIRHPRAFRKPLYCQARQHKFEDVVSQGVTFLLCKKCGAFILKSLYEKTMSKRDRGITEDKLDQNYTLKQKLINRMAYKKRMEQEFGARLMP